MIYQVLRKIEPLSTGPRQKAAGLYVFRKKGKTREGRAPENERLVFPWKGSGTGKIKHT
ncbi:hypothetical protein [Dysgonomonas reticulitermitis]